MALIDGIPPLSNWTFRPTKLHAYEALLSLNRCFEATLLSLVRLDPLGLFRQEFLNAYRIPLECTRAQANDELIHTLQNLEQETPPASATCTTNRKNKIAIPTMSSF